MYSPQKKCFSRYGRTHLPFNLYLKGGKKTHALKRLFNGSINSLDIEVIFLSSLTTILLRWSLISSEMTMNKNKT